jgi:hypothetical protein
LAHLVVAFAAATTRPTLTALFAPFLSIISA